VYLVRAILAVFAEDSLGFVVLCEIDLICVVFLEPKLMLLIDQLYFVRHIVCAHLLGVEEVHSCGVLANVELPVAEQLLTEAVHGLVGGHGGHQEGSY